MTEPQPHIDEAQRRAERFCAVFGTPSGMQVLDDLKAFAHYARPKIAEDAAGRVDPGKSLVLCGMETVLIFIHDQLTYNPQPRPARADMGDE